MSEAKKLLNHEELALPGEPALDLNALSLNSAVAGAGDELPRLPSITADEAAPKAAVPADVSLSDRFLYRLNKILIVMLWAFAAGTAGFLAGVGAAAIVLGGVLDKNSAWVKEVVKVVKVIKEVVHNFSH